MQIKKTSCSIRTILKEKYGYLLIILLASIPLMNNSLIKVGAGHDIYFHLMRIEGIAEGLISGQFPVKIQPGWYDGYGYGCSVFYGDIFLYIPAVFRILGLPIQNAYKLYVLFCNIATVAVAGYSFEKIFQSKKIGLIGSFLYTLSVYRLINIYVRAAVGEYTAMIFLPLVVYATILLLKDTKELRKGWILLSLSMTGIIQCHIISAEIVTVMLGLLCIICIKRLLNWKVIIALIKAVGFAVALNLGFMVPFIDYMINGKFNVNAINGGWRVEQNIQKLGITFSQMGKIFYHAIKANGETDIGVGMALIVALPVALLIFLSMRKSKMYNSEKLQDRWFVVTMLLFAVLSLWMSTCFFPWEAIRKSNVLFRYMVINIQFPWRLCTIATVSLTLLWCISLKCLSENKISRYIKIAVASLFILVLVQAGYIMVNILSTGEYYQVWSVADMDTSVESGEEYLPLYTLSDELKKDNIVADEKINIGEIKRKGVRLEFACQNLTDEEAKIAVPLIYYKGYQAEATDLEKGGTYELDTFIGENNVVAMYVPTHFTGTVTVDFMEPVYWRIAEGISLLAVLSLVIYLCIEKKELKRRAVK